MPRIRTIKPEFWVDEKVVELSFPARLLFIGLWNFADDQGYVDYSPRRIRMQVFPGDQLDVEVLIGELVGDGLVRAYDSPIGPLLHIANWTKHQRIDKPGKARFDAESLRPFPTPPRAVDDMSANPPRTFVEPSGSPRELSRADLDLEVDLDLEGKGKEVPATPAREIALRPASELSGDTAQVIVGEWLERCTKRPASQVVGQVAKLVKSMLGEGIDPDDIRRGMAHWKTKGLHPSALPSVVNEVQNATPSGRVPTTTLRAQDSLALAERFAREEAAS